MYKAVLEVRRGHQADGVTFTAATFNNMEEAWPKLVAGQVQADVFFPTID